MASMTHPDQRGERRSQLAIPRLPRFALALLLIPALAAVVVPATLYVRAAGVASPVGTTPNATRSVPADLFVRSIVLDDGALGWHQLCPNVQAQVPLDSLVQQASAQRDAASKAGLTLTSSFLGAVPMASGGQLRVYVLTAHWSNGATELRTYSVSTQRSGCVADVKNQ
jgi:hypothetical protein